MHLLQTAVIEHTTADGVHHDWLIEDPTLPDPKSPIARLWTARVTPPPQVWHRLERFDLTVIPPHRRAYLDYQGPVSRDRGRVRRLARGSAVASHWAQARIDLTVRFESSEIVLRMDRCGGDHWLAVVRTPQA